MRPVKSGFTVIELIVVIVIVGLIAAMAGPSFRSFIDASRLSFSSQLVETTLGKGFSQARARPRAMLVRGWEDSRRMELIATEDGAQGGECMLSEATCQQLDSGVTFAEDFTIEFTPPYGDISNSNDVTEIEIMGRTKKVNILVHHISGLVETMTPEEL